MITEHDLQEAIAECLAVPNPNSNVCLKLAAFYTILEHLYPGREDYSTAPPPDTVGKTTIKYTSDTDFGRLIYGRDPSEVWPLIDELVTDALRVLNPRLYEGFIRRLQ